MKAWIGLTVALFLSASLVLPQPTRVADSESKEEDTSESLLFFAHSGPERECVRLSVFDDAASSRTRYTISRAVAVGVESRNARMSRLAATRGMTMVFSIRALRPALALSHGTVETPFVHLTLLELAGAEWNMQEVFLDRPSTTSGGIAVTEDNRALLVSTQENEEFCEPQRFFVGRYPLSDLPIEAGAAWPADRRFVSESPIGEILVDGPLAHLVTAPLWDDDPDLPQEVISIDTRTMTEIAERIRIEPTIPKGKDICNGSIPNLRAELSNDGRHLFTNRFGPTLNVVDLVRREAETIAIPSEVFPGSGDLAFNRFRTDIQLLAVHMISKIVLFEWLPDRGLVQRDAVPIEFPDYGDGVRLPIAWTRGGDIIAAATLSTDVDYLRWRIGTGNSFSRSTNEYDLCSAPVRITPGEGRTVNGQVDVISANDVAPLQRPPGYASPTAPATERPSATPTPTIAPSATATATDEPTPWEIDSPNVLYFPTAIR